VEVSSREGGLDRVLSLIEPVHRAIELVGAHLTEAEVGPDGRIAEQPGSSQLGTRLGRPGGDETHHDVSLATRGSDHLGQLQLLYHGETRSDMAVQKRALDRKALG